MSRRFVILTMVLVLLCSCTPSVDTLDNLEIRDSGQVYHIYCVSMGVVVFESSASNISRVGDFIHWDNLNGHNYQWKGDYLITTEVQ